MPDVDAVHPGMLVIGIGAGALVLIILVAMILLGIAALGTPRDRIAGNETLRRVAGLLGGRFRDRLEYPWYRRPSQYGAVEGEFGEIAYELNLMPWNAEDCGGSVLVRIRSRLDRQLAGNRSEIVIFTPPHVWHWPDLADPDALADYVRQAVAIVKAGKAPPDAA